MPRKSLAASAAAVTVKPGFQLRQASEEVLGFTVSTNLQIPTTIGILHRRHDIYVMQIRVSSKNQNRQARISQVKLHILRDFCTQGRSLLAA